MKNIFSILSLICTTLLIVACNNDMDEEKMGQGYLTVQIETNVNTITRAVTNPSSDYAPKKLHVEVQDAQGDVAKSTDGKLLSTDDFDNSDLFKGKIKLNEGTYTIVAHSANWDGSNSAYDAPYYAGSATVTVAANTSKEASVICQLANVKVTVNYDENFKKYFESAKTVVTSSLPGVTSRSFEMNEDSRSAYFPVGNLTFKVTVNNDASKSQENTITDVKARDHYIINYTVADPTGSQGPIKVFIDESEKTYTYTIEVPREGANNLEAMNVSPWGKFVDLLGNITLEKNDYENVTLQWKRRADSNWTTVANNALTNNDGKYTYRLKGLSPETAYTYRFVYANGDDQPVYSNEVNFTTEAATPLYNGGFELWRSVDSYYSPNGEGVDYWDSSNPGSADYNFIVTTRESGFVHGGSYSVKLASQYAVIKLAAGSVYTGKFGEVDGTTADLYWGVPFTARPTAFKGYISYSPGSINRGDQPSGVGAPAKGSNDIAQIRVALLTERLHVDNSDMSTFPDWNTDPRVIAYGEYMQNTSDNGQWKEINIPLKYHTLTKKPTHILVVAASSKYGDYFYGSDTSVLYLDDFELIYGDNPTTE